MCGCKDVSSVKVIKIVYINSRIDLSSSLGCWDIFSIDSLFLSQVRITDPKVTEPIYDIVKNLKVDTSRMNVDVRTTCLLRYNISKVTDTLCLGESFGTVLNGQYVVDNEKLFDLIKKHIHILEECPSCPPVGHR